jgi:aryl-alcohol dehydrogenase-like predicted oxidoreductase
MIKLGETGLEVTKLGLGAAPFGSCYGETNKEDCEKTLNRALEEGTIYIDTAPWYGNGET